MSADATRMEWFRFVEDPILSEGIADSAYPDSSSLMVR